MKAQPSGGNQNLPGIRSVIIIAATVAALLTFSAKGVMTRILVIRFGSLGDLCLLGWAAAERRDRTSPGAETVTLVTKPRFADLMRGVRGVDEVIAPQDLAAGDILRLAGILRGRNFDTILDAHNILRGHLLLAMMGRRPEKRLAKDTSARLWFMRTGRRSPALDRTMGDRFREVMLDPGETADPVPATMVPPLAAMVPPATMRRGILGLAPGAQWDAKRWPPAHFATLVRDFLTRNEAEIRIFLGPREEGWFSSSPLQDLTADSRVTLVHNRPLPEVAADLAACRLVVTNDSGLLHLAEAVGTPVLAFFGPTVREFGYFPRLPHSAVLERDLTCRPCSRNGKRPCHRGDLACLDDITPQAAGRRLQAMWSALEPTESP